MPNISYLFVFLLLLLSGCTQPRPVIEHTLPAECPVYDMHAAVCIDETELTVRLASYRVIFIGDHHTQKNLHKKIAALLGRLDRTGRNVSLANEWFVPGDDPLLQQYAQNSFEGNFTEAIGWKEKAGYPFVSYAPIYDAVRSTGGGLYGINLTREERSHISDANRSALTPDMQRFYDTLDLNLTAHRRWLSPFFAHCHSEEQDESDEECAARMYRVQVAWDCYMAAQADKLAKRVLKTSEDLLVVFAGAMHLNYGLGINARFARVSREPFVTIRPVPDSTKKAEVGEADYLLLYPFEPPTFMTGK